MDFTNLPATDGRPDYEIEHEARMRELGRRPDAPAAQPPSDEDRASSPDGAVTVVVGPGGVLNDITFGPKASELSHPQLRASVLAAYRLGCDQADGRRAEAAAGPDAPALPSVREAIPPTTAGAGGPAG
jgi:hypothetical protein